MKNWWKENWFGMLWISMVVGYCALIPILNRYAQKNYLMSIGLIWSIIFVIGNSIARSDELEDVKYMLKRAKEEKN
jgi:hypothetical protein